MRLRIMVRDDRYKRERLKGGILEVRAEMGSVWIYTQHYPLTPRRPAEASSVMYRSVGFDRLS